MKRNVLKAIPYGFIKGIVITILLQFYLSSFARNISVGLEFGLSALATILFAAVYFILERKEKSFKSISLFFLLNLLSFVFSLAVIILLMIIIRHSFFEIVETNNADGLMLILDLSCFIGISFVLEFGISAVIFLKNKGKPQ